MNMKIKMAIFPVALAALSLSSTTAAAQWIHQETGSAFEGPKTQIALAAQGRYAVALRCTGANDLEILLITPEAVDNTETLATVNAIGVEILVRVDQNEPYSLPAEAGTSIDGELLIIANAPIALLRELNEANSSMSVAMRALGSLFHEAKFSARGSTASTATLSDRCGLP